MQEQYGAAAMSETQCLFQTRLQLAKITLLLRQDQNPLWQRPCQRRQQHSENM